MDIIFPMNGLMNKMPHLRPLATLWTKRLFHRHSKGIMVFLEQWSLVVVVGGFFCYSVLFYFYKRSVQPIILTNQGL